jgi:hypothetical protein
MGSAPGATAGFVQQCSCRYSILWQPHSPGTTGLSQCFPFAGSCSSEQGQLPARIKLRTRLALQNDVIRSSGSSDTRKSTASNREHAERGIELPKYKYWLQTALAKARGARRQGDTA